MLVSAGNGYRLAAPSSALEALQAESLIGEAARALTTMSHTSGPSSSGVRGPGGHKLSLWSTSSSEGALWRFGVSPLCRTFVSEAR